MVKNGKYQRKPVSAAKFYGAAKAGVRVGKKLYKAYKEGKKLYNKTKQAMDGRGKPSGSRSLAVNANLLQSALNQHNDWDKRPAKVIWIGKRRTFKTLGSFKLEHSSSGIVSGSQGTQAHNFIDEKMNVAQLSGTTSTVFANQSNRWITDPFALNPYSAPIANSIYPSGGSAPAADDKLYIKSVSTEVRIVSLTNIAQRVKVFHYLCIKTPDSSIGGMFLDAVNSGAYLQTTSASGPNSNASTLCVAGAASISDIGQVPHQYYTFRKFFKLIESDQFMLQPGDQISKHVKFMVNKMVTREQVTSTLLYVPGISVCTLVITDAGLVGLEATLDAGTSRCAPGASKVGYVVNDIYNFAALPVNRYNIHRLEIGYNQNDATDVRKIVNAEDAGVAQEVE